MNRAALLLAAAAALTTGGAARSFADPAPASVDVLPTFVGAKASPDDVAIVIGIEKYRSVPPSQYSASDAKLVGSYLVAMGYPSRNVDVRTDDLATLSDIKRDFERWLPNHVKPDSRVVIYYSGHGAPDPATGSAFLVPWDGDPNYLQDTAYPVKRLEDELAKLPVKQVIVILDACFSGAGKNGEGRTLLAADARPLIVSKPQAPLASPNIAVLSAARQTEISASNSAYKHGLLTYHLLAAIQGGKKSLSDIYADLKPKVEDDAKAQNIEQQPQLLLPDTTPPSTGKFLLADYASVSYQAPKPVVSPEETAALAAEKKRIADEQAKLAAQQKALEEQQKQAEEALDQKKRQMAADEAARREAEEER
ncbi:MAG: caspase family protein, partial [Elusimicrobia bacterium]|nr:caspase family protein [Elusimicrobiota bacterium]